MGVPPKPSGTQVPLALRAIPLLYCSLQTFDVFPPSGLGPTAETSSAGWALSLNEDLNSQVGSLFSLLY